MVRHCPNLADRIIQRLTVSMNRRHTNPDGLWIGSPRPHPDPKPVHRAHAARPRSRALLDALPRPRTLRRQSSFHLSLAPSPQLNLLHVGKNWSRPDRGRRRLVPRLHSFRNGLRHVPVRDISTIRTRRLDCHGRIEREVRLPGRRALQRRIAEPRLNVPRRETGSKA